MGRHTGTHIQELGERTRVAVQPGGRFGRGLKGWSCAVRAGRKLAEQEDTVMDPTSCQSAPDVGERLESSHGHRGRRREAGQHR